MIVARIAGRTLCVCLPVFLLAALAVASPPAPPKLARARGLSIQHQEGRFDRTSGAWPEVTHVRRAVQQAYKSAPPDALDSEIVRTSLAVYGDQVTESTTPLGYVLRWNPITEQWEWVCISRATFAVDLGLQGTVLVEVEDTLVLL